MVLNGSDIARIAPIAEKNIIGPDVVLFLWFHSYHKSQLLETMQRCGRKVNVDQWADVADKRFIEHLSSQLLLSQVMSADVPIAHASSGRPFLEENDVLLSISHTKGAYAVSLSGMQHGIDVETWGDRALRVQSMFVNNEEQSLLNGNALLTTSERTATLLWSAKEAVYKCLDIEGLSFKNDITLTPRGPHQLKAMVKGQCHPLFVRYNEYEPCVFTCCSTEPFSIK